MLLFTKRIVLTEAGCLRGNYLKFTKMTYCSMFVHGVLSRQFGLTVTSLVTELVKSGIIAY